MGLVTHSYLQRMAYQLKHEPKCDVDVRACVCVCCDFRSFQGMLGRLVVCDENDSHEDELKVGDGIPECSFPNGI